MGVMVGSMVHQDIRENHLHPALAQQPRSGQGPLQRSGQLGDPIVHLGTVRIDADLDSVQAQLRQAVRLVFADHDGVGLDLDAEQQRARILQQLEEIAAQEHLAAAEHQKENSGRGELIEQVLDLGRGHFAVVVVVQVTVDTPLIAAVGDVHLDAQRDAHFERFRAHFLHQAHWIKSHTRASGKNVSRKTGTRLTSSHADWKTRPTSSES